MVFKCFEKENEFYFKKTGNKTKNNSTVKLNQKSKEFFSNT